MLRDWETLFKRVKNRPYSRSLHEFLEKEYQNEIVYPPRSMIFQAFKYTNPSTLKAVIIGQDPYHNPGEAMGLSFSVPNGTTIPPSLQNIYQEIENDLNLHLNKEKGDLSIWARQGVLLLNAYLTVRAHQPLSHAKEEYRLFLEDVLRYLEEQKQPLVYFLWGSFARSYKKFIYNPKHLVLESVHPSPLSANRGGWFNQHQFSRCNQFLLEHDVSPIDWRNE